MESNGLFSIIRAHEPQIEGYKMHSWNGQTEFPAVITIFSAPNYCDVYNNKGAIIKFNVKIKKYFYGCIYYLSFILLYKLI